MFNPLERNMKAIKNPILLTDGYKFCHKDQYPEGLEWTYETWIPRKSRVDGVNHVIFFGLQGMLCEMVKSFEEGFFSRPLSEVMAEIRENLEGVFSKTNPEMVNEYDYSHFEKLHKLGYLPIKIKAVKEGTFIPIGVPMFTIENTHKDFFWLPGYLETQMSSYIWQTMTDATLANYYKRVLMDGAKRTGANINAVECQAGDFSMRGMGSPEAAYRAGAGHLLSFGASATIPTRNYLKAFYNASPDVITYAPSTEHSVMCSYGTDEKKAFLELITKVYPSGTVTIVADSYDFWNIVDRVLPDIKDVILSRKGRVNIRPDSGDPVKIICGDESSENDTIKKGLVERLYEIFGGIVNEKGFKELDPHIGVIYGDSITVERAKQIVNNLIEKNFVSTSAGLGVGSYTYQYMTRDTLGFALKGTAEIIDGQFKKIYKDPKTDLENFKRSKKGMVAVVFEEGTYKCIDYLNPDTEPFIINNELQEVFRDGRFTRIQDFESIRQRVKDESIRVYGI
ncbi:MAG: nicotinate phosphoribosyltransferase [Clostridia bacterium]|nr:nicotinate phosphoribosyltransferase [Clostridia bacterium]